MAMANMVYDQSTGKYITLDEFEEAQKRQKKLLKEQKELEKEKKKAEKKKQKKEKELKEKEKEKEKEKKEHKDGKDIPRYSSVSTGNRYGSSSYSSSGTRPNYRNVSSSGYGK